MTVEAPSIPRNPSADSGMHQAVRSSVSRSAASPTVLRDLSELILAERRSRVPTAHPRLCSTKGALAQTHDGFPSGRAGAAVGAAFGDNCQRVSSICT